MWSFFLTLVLPTRSSKQLTFYSSHNSWYIFLAASWVMWCSFIFILCCILISWKEHTFLLPCDKWKMINESLENWKTCHATLTSIYITSTWSILSLCGLCSCLSFIRCPSFPNWFGKKGIVSSLALRSSISQFWSKACSCCHFLLYELMEWHPNWSYVHPPVTSGSCEYLVLQ